MMIKILIRNAFRHKLRSVLTIAGIAIAVLAYGLLHTVIDAWYAGVAASSANRLVTRKKKKRVLQNKKKKQRRKGFKKKKKN